MAQLNPRLMRRTLVLAKVESTPGTDAAPTPAADAILVASPSYETDLQILQRDFVRADLSPIGIQVGRKLAHMKFGVELRGNGLQQDGATDPKIGRLLQGCGFSRTGITTAGPGAVRAVGNHSAAVTWSSAGTYNGATFPDCQDFLLTCVLAGASATAKLRVDELNGADTTLLK